MLRIVFFSGWLLAVPAMAQSTQEQPHLSTEHRISQGIDQVLRDFDHKINNVFVASYKDGFSTIRKHVIYQGTSEKRYASDVDFESGEEYIKEEDGKFTFELMYKTEGDEIYGGELKSEMVRRILKSLPKGFVALEEDGYTLIKFNPEHADKSAHQGTIKVWLVDGDEVRLSYRQPELK